VDGENSEKANFKGKVEERSLEGKKQVRGSSFLEEWRAYVTQEKGKRRELVQNSFESRNAPLIQRRKGVS